MPSVIQQLEELENEFSSIAGCGCNHNWGWCEATRCGDAYVLSSRRRELEAGDRGAEARGIRLLAEYGI